MVQHHIAVVDDNPDHCLVVEKFLQQCHPPPVIEKFANGTDFLKRLKDSKHPVDLVLLDFQMPTINGLQTLKAMQTQSPQIPVIMMTAYGSIDQAVEAIKEGALDYLTKPFSNFSDFRLRIERVLRQGLMLKQNLALRAELGLIANPNLVFGQSQAMKHIKNLSQKAAATQASVLITGECGTGKDVLARYLHDQSPRKKMPFVVIDCTHLPKDLLEAELFGFTKGAFTGAYEDKQGLVESANGGTIFLDEVAEIPLPLQVKFLRFLQNNEVRALGSVVAKKMDVRVIAATNRDLTQDIRSKRFREDLYFRLNVIRLHLPPLRSRPEDIRPLTEFFLAQFNLIQNRSIAGVSPAAFHFLEKEPWPGNIRELKNTLERAFCMTPDNEDLRAQSLMGTNPLAPPPPPPLPFHLAKDQLLTQFFKSYLTQLMIHTQGNITQAAGLAKLGRQNLHRLLNLHHLEARPFRKK